ncbi:flavodoxin family protein [Sporomusa termitida]|uniref:NAD(P)H-dependent FMN-containing oxidoreductase YwqN n=1 Tax=Sporomusa termitida TaxID=2377 RepID=A0A517DNM1_9FIRM|nr:flavodoxin family protein [Sporomusa termitida]QDR78942.1 Putative NAD(P)H-dependent FMN-containing oxidoreductase YwqN [Sporomusa termitida]
MGKNILVLTGSPRQGGNSDMLADAFIKGARAGGHTVAKFATAAKKIGGCRACEACWSKNTACSIQDDFAELEPLLESAATLVLASPLYWFGVSSHLKAAIDKFYAYTRPGCKRPLKIKESLLLICGADEGLGVFTGAIETYKGIVDYMKWQDKGILAVPSVSAKGAIVHTEALKQAEKLGAEI